MQSCICLSSTVQYMYTVLYIKLLYCISTLTGVLVQIFESEFGDLR